MRNKILLIIVIFLLIFGIYIQKLITNGNATVVPSDKKFFSEIKLPCTSIFQIQDISLHVVDNTKVIIHTTHLMSGKYGDYFLFNPETNKLKKLNDKVFKKTEYTKHLKNELFLIFLNKTNNYKFGLYNFNTKEIKYFYNHIKGAVPKDVVLLDNTNFLMSSMIREYDSFNGEFEYEICNLDSMSCKTVAKNNKEKYEKYFTPLIINIDSGKALIISNGNAASYADIYLYDIKTDKISELNKINFKHKDYITQGGVYKKNHIYLLKQSYENETKIILYKFKNNKLIEIGNYTNGYIPKKTTGTYALAVDENTIILIGGSNWDSLDYLKDVYYFNTETKQYSKIDTIKCQIKHAAAERLNESKWLLYGYINYIGILQFNKKGLDE